MFQIKPYDIVNNGYEHGKHEHLELPLSYHTSIVEHKEGSEAYREV
jgi:hypothetical protein